MDTYASLAVAKTAINAGQIAHKGWGVFKRWWNGTISITHPRTLAIVNSEWVEIEGLHNNPKGHFWLMSVLDREYWLKTPVSLRSDGRWQQRIHIGGPGKRTCDILLVWVAEFTHSLFTDIKARSDSAKNWNPVKMRPDKKQFSIVESLVLQVEIPKPSGGTP